MKVLIYLFLILGFFSVSNIRAQSSVEQLLSYPFPENLCSSPLTGKVAWTVNQRGIRNIFISLDSGRTISQLTHSTKDEGQIISRLQFSNDGNWLVFLKGAEPGANWSASTVVNPRSMPEKPHFSLQSINLRDGKIITLAENPSSAMPVVSPNSKRVAFIRGGSVWTVPIDGTQRAQQLFFDRGSNSGVVWSPDSRRIAFVSSRSEHSFIGIYTDKSTPIKWVDPSFSRDTSPRWSPDGSSLAFVRVPLYGRASDSILLQYPKPWEIRVANIEELKSNLIWKSSETLKGSVPTTSGGFNLHWTSGDRIVFLSTEDNWPHLYSISSKGGNPILLTPGDFMVEHLSLSPDKKSLLFSANAGNNQEDIDRRHVAIVSVDKPDMRMVTRGNGIESFPVFFSRNTVALISSTAIRPPLPAITDLDGRRGLTVLGDSMMGAQFSPAGLVTPVQVIVQAKDGTPIHCQLFNKESGTKKKPAILFIHGGPMRQMLLGWSHMDYYAMSYAINQKLADLGFVVLSVNYRLGIGYGDKFHKPGFAGKNGISEYQDILAAGKWLVNNPNVDASKIGVYGGSYGGYLTALALGKNSDIFKAGVDISGVHSRVPKESYATNFEHAPDALWADTVAWRSSPISYVDTWRSPVLLIHADDDRNVDFVQTTNLVRRLMKRGIYYETLVIPDDTHHWLIFENMVKVSEATIDFLVRMLLN